MGPPAGNSFPTPLIMTRRLAAALSVVNFRGFSYALYGKAEWAWFIPEVSDIWIFPVVRSILHRPSPDVR
jgi:hypothetical protein